MKKYGFSVIALETGDSVFESDGYQTYQFAKKALVEWLNERSDIFLDSAHIYGMDGVKAIENAVHELWKGEESVKVYGDLNWKAQVELLEDES